MIDDVPSPIDFRDRDDALAWAREAEAKRPGRPQLREAISDLLRTANARSVLELGPGPGWLAECVLRSCPVEHYMLFDFSQAMLALARDRLGEHTAASFVLGDFKQPKWTRHFAEPCDAVVAMQSVHELRHKRHIPDLYRQVREILRRDGLLVVCDHEPRDASARSTALYATQAEQLAAFLQAGFVRARTELSLDGLYVCVGQRS